ncbi:MAG: hypothetical protein IPM53_18905 [Anaerolineaceae bacterium]|nr:hypothetical protein [Anaerolineaceae bacterium]
MNTFLEHLWLTALPWFIGIVCGGGLGYFVARVIRPFWETQSTFRSVLLIAPWRTLGALILLLTVRSPLLLRYFGLGQATALVWLTILSCLVAFGRVLSLFLTSPQPPTTTSRAIASARTMAVGLSVAAIIASDAGAGGAGELISTSMLTLDQNLFISGVLTVVAVSVILDILLGIVQVLWRNTSL